MKAIMAIIPENFLQGNVFGRVPPERFNDILPKGSMMAGFLPLGSSSRGDRAEDSGEELGV
jgi:hypothetical protein